jgi:hypothetical protein
MTSQNNGPTVGRIYPPSFQSVAMYYVPRRFVPLSNLHSYLVRKTPTIVFPDKTDYNLYEVIFLFAAALYIFNFENYNICNLHIEKIQVFKFKYESTRERERESKRARERERER